MWQRPVQKLGEGRDDLDTVEQDPQKQEGATKSVQQPGKLRPSMGPGSWDLGISTQGKGQPIRNNLRLL